MSSEGDNAEMVLQETAAAFVADAEDIDLWLLKDSLAKTPWERMQANDDAANFGESLRIAMKKRPCKT